MIDKELPRPSYVAAALALPAAALILFVFVPFKALGWCLQRAVAAALVVSRGAAN